MTVNTCSQTAIWYQLKGKKKEKVYFLIYGSKELEKRLEKSSEKIAV